MLARVQLNRATQSSQAAVVAPLGQPRQDQPTSSARPVAPPVDPAPPASPAHPLGPLFYRVQPVRAMRARGWALAVFLVCSTVLVVAVCLSPAASGLGTHRQLGLQPCSMIVLFGYPCPTCGMTTAFSNAVRGEFISAFRAQPAGLVFAVGTALAAAMGLSTVVTGRVWTINWYRIPPGRLLIGIVLLIVSGWGFKLLTGMMAGTLPAGP